MGETRDGMTTAPSVGVACGFAKRFDLDRGRSLIASAGSRDTLTALPKVDTNSTTPSLIPTVNGNTVRSLSTHGQQSAAKGSSTTVSRSEIRLIQHLDSSAHGLVRRWRLIGYFHTS
jgi:hypothetical protein